MKKLKHGSDAEFMPNWNSVLQEINQSPLKEAINHIRREYIKKVYEKTGRNVIFYYSGFLQKTSSQFIDINDDDKNAFMNAIHLMDRSKGLDLVLHTPGGSVAAVESIVDYLWVMFNKDIRVIVPQIAMSGGTMIACAAKEIIMGKQSNLGPIDPQFSGLPAHGVIEEFNAAIEAVKNTPHSLPIWQAIIGKYPPTFIGECQKAMDMANQIVGDWLFNNMFDGEADALSKSNRIVSELTDHATMKTHGRHISLQKCLDIGLKISKLEDDQDLQELILTTHHAYMHSFSQGTAVKIVENHLGAAMIVSADGSQQN